MSEEERFAMVLLCVIEQKRQLGYSDRETVRTLEIMIKDVLDLLEVDE